ncbi:DUF805 domain-containing protein [Bradyrhizobium sp. HKCCYLS20291]|uniref:DUF805 domain-containing protein n=1 Tax=Bradyrhizobium sp. HKCCYLS20291 TaxID=3420766 RepID=UPI003EC00EB0
MTYLRGFFSFSGRINRAQYAMVMLFGYIGSILVFWLTWPHLRAMGDLGVALGMTNVAVILWILFAAMAKRLHDINRSGLSSLRILVPVIGIYTPCSLFFIPGDPSGNDYGSPPDRF